MNQVHVIFTGRRASFSSMDEAFTAIKFRLMVRRFDTLLDAEFLHLLRQIFLLE